MSANFVGNTLTQSEAIETYTPYDVTSFRPRKTKIAFFANFRGIEELFCAPDQSLNLKIMNQCNIHLIPKWRLSQMIWVELHENEASRAKRQCLQMLL